MLTCFIPIIDALSRRSFQLKQPADTKSAADGAKIPVVGLGTGGRMDEDCADIVASALRSGCRHIDTSRNYGSEPAIGRAIRAAGVPRQDIFITSKVAHEDLHAADVERSAETSLRELGIDWLDLLLVHWPNRAIPLTETMPAFAKVKRRGLARHIGVANFTVALLDEAVRCSPEPLAANQVEYHAHLDQSKVLGACRRHGLVLIAFCPLRRGLLLDDPVLIEIARSKRRSVAQVALRWLIQQDGVVAIPASSKPERVAENLALFDFSLTDDEMARIAARKRPDGRVAKPKERSPDWDV
jgi:diketogulonate reductase-like aldo/keto reductase